MISLDNQLICARRELALRKNVYPKWVANGRMSQLAADHEIEAMEAIVDTITKCKLLAEVSEEMKAKP